MTVRMLTGCVTVALIAFGIPARALTLADAGQARAVIVPSAAPIPAEQTAVAELAAYLQKITGAAFTVGSAAPAAGTARLLVGPSAAVRAILGDAVVDGLGPEEIVIRTVGSDLVLCGGRPRGTLYAVYGFLETLGCRWYAVDADEVIPRQPTLQVQDLAVRYRPPFEFRQDYTEALKDPRFAARLRQNGREFAAPIPEEFGGSVTMGGAHTLRRQFLKPDEHFKDHPDWYGLDKAGGERKPAAICFTAAGAREQTAREVLAYLDAHPGTEIVSVSCDDSNASCQCEACQALRTRAGGESGPLLDFVNAVADAVAAKYPRVRVSTLAYWHTDKPPATPAPRPNVLIQLGVLDRNHKDAIPDVPHFSRYVKRWHELAAYLYMWDYDPHFSNFIQPHPNHFVAGKSLRFYRDNGVTGVFTQGSWGSTGEFMHLRAWVTSQLLWDPDRDERALVTEFLNAYYGAAGPPLLQYLDLISAAVRRDPSLWLGVYDATTRHWLTLDDLNAATRLFAAAEAAVAADSALLYRVRRARLSLDVVWVERYRELRTAAQRAGRDFLGPEDPYAAVEQIARNEFKTNTYREWADLSEYAGKLRTPFPPRRGKTPAECDRLPAWAWEEIQEDRLTPSPAVAGAVTDDARASDGKALRLAGTDPAAEARFTFPADLAGRWRVYAVLRAEAAGDAPAAVVAGIYAWNRADGGANEVSRLAVPCSAEYRTVDLGAHRLEKDATIQVQPQGVGGYGQVKATFVDRLFLIGAD
jgi:hypothetical protein